MKTVQRLLIIKTNFLGDVLNFIPVYNGLRKYFPGAKVGWVVTETGADVVKEFTDVDEILLFRTGEIYDYKNIFHVGTRLRSFKPDMVITSYQEECFLVSLLALLSGAKRRIGYALKKQLTFFNETVPVVIGRRRVDMNLDILRHLGMRDVTSLLYFRRHWDPDEDAFISTFRRKRGLEQAYAVLHLFSDKPTKSWPLTNGLQFIRLFQQQGDVFPLLIGNDHTLDEFIVAYPQLKKFVVKQVTLRELYFLIKHAHMFIGIDSFPLQLSEFTNTPRVAIFGSTDPVENLPEATILLRKELACSSCWPRQDCQFQFRCLAEIMPEDVMNVIETILQKKPDDNQIPGSHLVAFSERVLSC